MCFDPALNPKERMAWRGSHRIERKKEEEPEDRIEGEREEHCDYCLVILSFKFYDQTRSTSFDQERRVEMLYV